MVSPKEHFYIRYSDLPKLYISLSKDYSVYVPVKHKDQLVYKKFEDAKDDTIILGEVRPVEPIRSFLMRAQERLHNYFARDDKKRPRKPAAIIGAKACDLDSLRIQDHVFRQGDFEDQQYIDNRDSALIISCDCTTFIETCWCIGIGGKPYPTKEFDLNFSTLLEGCAVEIGSEHGREVIAHDRNIFTLLDQSQLRIKEEKRNRLYTNLEKELQKRNYILTEAIKGKVPKKWQDPLWEKYASTCVECGGCNLVCPTCHCFLLFDQAKDNKAARYRLWDACLYKTFAKVAGGANPRKHLYERLRNRFDKKFEYFPNILGDYQYACTGCGRCISVCPGKIDIREVLKDLAK